MASVHFRQSQTPLCNERHLSTIKATLHRFKVVLEESGERQSVLTSLYRALWDTLQKDFQDLDEPSNKRVKSSSDEGELLGLLQSSLHSLITSTRNDLTTLEPKAGQKFQDPVTSAFHVLEEDDPETASRTRAEGLVLQAYMERGFSLEAEGLACRRSFEETVDMHDAGNNFRNFEDKSLECDIRGRLQTWEKALELCNGVIKLKKPDEEETQNYEPVEMEDLSQDVSNVSIQDQELIIPTSPEEATRVLSGFRPSQNIPATLEGILAAKADPNIIIGAGGIAPLHNVIAFARKAHVRFMRRLLLEAGAMESDAMKERWELRCRADASDEAWVANFHQEPTLVPNMSCESP